MKNPDAAHFKRIEQYAGNIYQMYLKTLRDITRLLHTLPIDTSKPFNFNDYPSIKQRVDNYILELTKKVKAQVENGISAEWLQANLKNDKYLDKILKGSRLSEAQRKVYYSRNQAGQKAFIQRKADGLNLSDRVWLYTTQYKNEIEMAVDVAISEKVSAQNLSQTVRQYLQQPNTLFRRVRDKNGVLQLSKKAAAYHPGRGVYRSSYKNAMRLARTEINMAYRTADHDRMNDLPFIIGYEVRLSSNHPVRDICDHLKGDYPKEFKFKGWHPQCRCHVISKMVSDAEFNAIESKLLAGQDISNYKSPSSVTDVPKGFTSWVQANKERAKGWSSLPYFMRDNPDFVKELKVAVPPATKPVPVKTESEPKFVPANTVSQAEAWAVNNISEKASYKGIPVQFVNQWNEGIFNHIQKFPELRKDIEFIGTIQDRNVLYIENAINEAIAKNTTLWRLATSRTNNDIEAAKNMLKKMYRKQIGRTDPHTMAQATEYPGIRGVTMNQSFFKDSNRVMSALKHDVESGFHPVGCDSVKSVIDHEMGHRVDHLLGLRKNPDILKLYSDNYVNISTGLSRYAHYYPKTEKGVAEFIAEGWSEYMNNPNPRQLSKEIAKIIENEYKRQYRKI